MVFRRPEFIQYFQTATPVSELGRLNIGSRPAKRPKKGGGVETLRAIPWIFAWTQTRMHLPVWLGIGRALQQAIDAGRLDDLRDMYQNWPFFQGTLDLVEMVLAKADPTISMLYDKILVQEELWGLGEELRRRLLDTKQTILVVAGKATLLEGYKGVSLHATADLSVKLSLRAPYVAPLNIMQCLCLKSLRDYEEKLAKGEEVSAYEPQDPEVLDLLSRDPNLAQSDQVPFVRAMNDALIITIKGIAAGMQNTG